MNLLFISAVFQMNLFKIFGQKRTPRPLYKGQKHPRLHLVLFEDLLRVAGHRPSAFFPVKRGLLVSLSSGSTAEVEAGLDMGFTRFLVARDTGEDKVRYR